MTVDLEERHRLADFLGLAVVDIDVDGPLVEERLVEPIELGLQLPRLPSGFHELRFDLGLSGLPDLQD